MLVTHLCPTLCNPLDCSLPGSSARAISQPMNGVGCHSLLQGILPPRHWTQVSCITRQVLYHLSHQGSPMALGPYNIRHILFKMKIIMRASSSSLWWYLHKLHNQRHSKGVKLNEMLAKWEVGLVCFSRRNLGLWISCGVVMMSGYDQWGNIVLGLWGLQ